MKSNIWRERKIIGSFYENKFLLSKLQMSSYPEPDSHIREKVKALLFLSNYATQKKLE